VPELAGHAHALTVNVGDIERAAEFLLVNGKDDPATLQAAAVPFLHLSGLVCAGWRVAQAARAAHAALAESENNRAYLQGVLAIADFWFATYAPQVRAQAETVIASACVAAAPESAFIA